MRRDERRAHEDEVNGAFGILHKSLDEVDEIYAAVAEVGLRRNLAQRVKCL